jgi:tRNA 2-thiocytidine biosynthesis protein TtcA
MCKRIDSQCRKAVLTYNMITPMTKHIAVALSGGKDSITLLIHLHRLCGHGLPTFKLSAIHVDGKQSCGAGVSVSYLQSICDRLAVTLHVVHQPKVHNACYPCSYERRYLLFHTAKKHHIDTVAFGHHADDTTETILMNMLHKAELAAMHPLLYMKKYGITIIRPLIYTHESQIIAYMKEQGLLRVMCQCPIGAQSMRKKVRKLISDMKALFPDADSNLHRIAMKHYAADYKDPQ